VSPSAETIAAIASAPARGAIGVLRVSGPLVPALALAVLGFAPEPRRAHRARFLDRDGAPIDEGIALYFPAPASFTGEHVLELQGHGGLIVMDLLLARLLELGARAARAGEFSERAFLNGKMDVAQAEAVADLIDAGTASAARAAVRSMGGELSSRIAELQSLLTDLRVQVEAAIDFPDEDIDFLKSSAIASKLERVIATFDAIERAARQGALLRDGLTVVIAGEPNAGKSSLLNALAGEDVAIVTAAPGTTRDVLKQSFNLDGLPLHLIDTAGLREADDLAEREGVRRAREQLRRADLILHVIDFAAGGADTSLLEELPTDVPVTRVLNKIDLLDLPASAETGPNPRLFVSARTGAGIDLLRAHLKERAGYREIESGALAARRRHLDALRRARALADAAREATSEARGLELFAEDLRLAQRALGEITGEFGSEDLLGAIFGSFCIGK
jgi:tRNA modification GTPase